MEIMGEIQADLLDHTIPLSAIMRKARVLAFQLASDELAKWVGQELDGYEDAKDLPDYRLLHTSVTGTWTNGYWMVRNRGVPLLQINDKDIRDLLTTFPVLAGIRTVEQFAEPHGDQHFWLPPD